MRKDVCEGSPAARHLPGASLLQVHSVVAARRSLAAAGTREPAPPQRLSVQAAAADTRAPARAWTLPEAHRSAVGRQRHHSCRSPRAGAAAGTPAAVPLSPRVAPWPSLPVTAESR